MDNFEIFVLVALMSLTFIPWVLTIVECVTFYKAFSVVRCRDCDRYDKETHCCKFWPDEGYRHPDHFCAEGKRRDATDE